MAIVHFNRPTPLPETTASASEKIMPLHRELNRLVDEFFSNSPLASNREWGLAPYTASPAMNVSENERSYTVTAELPGIKENEIEVCIVDNALQIRGEKELAKEEKENGFLTMERSYGSFYRSIPFSMKIDENKIRAVLRDGVLTVEIPKAPEAVKSTKKITLLKA